MKVSGIRDYQARLIDSLSIFSTGIWGRWGKWCAFIGLALVPLLLVTSMWSYTGEKVDESELIHFAVGFLGGDLNPVWDGYGHLGMYLLGSVYFLLGLIPVTAGIYESWADYGTQLLSNGYFVIVARYVMSVAIVLTAFIGARTLVQQSIPGLLALLYFMVVTFSPWALKYSNYVRSDTLVMLMTAVCLYISVNMVGRRKLYLLATAVAAAISFKISASALVLLFGLAMAENFLQRKNDWKTPLLSGIWFLLCLIAFQPYQNPVGRITGFLATTWRQEDVIAYRTIHESILDRFGQILEFHIDILGAAVVILAAMSIIGLWTRYRRLVAYSWVVLASMTLPYLLSSDIREYWFIPAFPLLTLLAVIPIAILKLAAKKYLPNRLQTIPAVLVILVVIWFPLQESLNTYLDQLRYQQAYPKSSTQLAAEWLKENHLGKSRILVDRHFAWIYPKLFDPGNLKNSRNTSRLFIYERQSNQFLASVLEMYVYGAYREKYFASPGTYHGLTEIRVKPGDELNRIETTEICSRYSGQCDPVGSSQSGNVETLRLQPRVPIASDGSFYLKTKCSGDGYWVTYMFGEGAGTDHPPEWISCRQGKKTILHPNQQVWVDYFGAGNKLSDVMVDNRKTLFVTSPDGYRRFERIVRNQPDTPSSARAHVFVEHYQKLRDGRTPRIFNAGRGSVIEVYELN